MKICAGINEITERREKKGWKMGWVAEASRLHDVYTNLKQVMANMREAAAHVGVSLSFSGAVVVEKSRNYREQEAKKFIFRQTQKALEAGACSRASPLREELFASRRAEGDINPI